MVAAPFMRVLHTSDWHLGQTWNGRSRKKEFEAFLEWMLETVKDRKVDVLIVAGDIFDTSTPTTDTQKMYFRFLKRVSSLGPETIVISGNHDSPSLLDAPKPFLDEFRIHVVGVAASPEEELVVIRESAAEDVPPQLIVAAVPFLREREIRRAVEGESLKESDNRTVAGIRTHYESVCAAAEEIRRQYPNRSIPLVVTGHLFVAGITSPGEIREIHVGTLGQLGSDIFPDGIDYVALGHIHRPSSVGGRDVVRYSGSPIPMSFGETSQEKSVVLVDFDGRTPRIEKIPVPNFSIFLHLEGDLDRIKKSLKKLEDHMDDRDAFVEVVYTGREPIHDLVRQVEDSVTHKNIEIVRIQNNRERAESSWSPESDESLEDLSEVDVFDRLLEDNEKKGTPLDDQLKADLRLAYREVLERCLETE